MYSIWQATPLSPTPTHASIANLCCTQQQQQRSASCSCVRKLWQPAAIRHIVCMCVCVRALACPRIPRHSNKTSLRGTARVCLCRARTHTYVCIHVCINMSSGEPAMMIYAAQRQRQWKRGCRASITVAKLCLSICMYELVMLSCNFVSSLEEADAIKMRYY